VTTKVDLYDSAYRNYELDPYRQIRIETYGEDLGQTSWVTTEESKQIPTLLMLTSRSAVIEIGCGSGGYAVHLAAKVGCRIQGLDINSLGIKNAQELAGDRELQALAQFEQCDLCNPWPVQDAQVDAVFANDVLCHIPGRLHVLEEMIRVLKPGGRMLFSDALVIGGMVSHEEIATRSAIGYYIFSPPEENERLIATAGFRLLSATDTSQQAAGIADRWHTARSKRSEELIQAEGEDGFAGLQRFLGCVKSLTSERRLLRYVYLAEKPAGDSPHVALNSF